MIKQILHRTLAVPLRWASHWSGLALRQAHAVKQPRILMYHIIGDEELSASQFEWQIEFLRHEFEVVRLEILVDRLQSRTMTGREIVITFDDGVRNHFTLAWPILRLRNVPATFFVCPGLIESGDWVWRTELRMRLKHLNTYTRRSAARDLGCPYNDIEMIMEWTKQLPLEEREIFRDTIAKRTAGFSPSREEMARHAPLTWDQLRQMDEGLITIGSHTLTHPILTTLSDDVLQHEVADSRNMLEQALDRRIDFFSYPNGANDARVVGAVRGHYRAALTTHKAFAKPGNDLYTLPRIAAGDTRASFVRRLHRPTA
jgi:peptidoglycan/xylan/chitin deacetylase (PgdA/CDA1 family)